MYLIPYFITHRKLWNLARMPESDGIVGVWAGGVNLPMLNPNLHPGIIATKIQVQRHANTQFLTLSMILILSTRVRAAVQLVPLSPALSSGGVCLPQLAVEWNNHGVTPQEQKGPTPSVTNPFYIQRHPCDTAGYSTKCIFTRCTIWIGLCPYLIPLFLSWKDCNYNFMVRVLL